MSKIMVALIETVGFFGFGILVLIFLTLFIGSAIWVMLDMKKRRQNGVVLGLIVLVCPLVFAFSAHMLPPPAAFLMGLMSWPTALVVYSTARHGGKPAETPAPGAAKKPAPKPAARPTA